jgi:cell division protein FtsQ
MKREHPEERPSSPRNRLHRPNRRDPAERVETASPSARRRWLSRVADFLRVVAGVMLAAALVVGSVWAMRRYITTSPRFALREVLVSGQRRRTTEDVVREGGLATGRNLFTIDLDAVAAKLLRDPWIREVRVERRIPDAVAISVVEREAAGLVSLPEAVLVTRTGEVIKRFELGDPSDLPVVTGLSASDFGDDKEGMALAIKGALELMAEYTSTRLGERFPASEVHVDKGGLLSLVLQKSGVTLVLGAAPYRHKLERAQRVVTELDRRGAKPSVIMLDSDARPDRVIVRLK